MFFIQANQGTKRAQVSNTLMVSQFSSFCKLGICEWLSATTCMPFLQELSYCWRPLPNKVDCWRPLPTGIDCWRPLPNDIDCCSFPLGSYQAWFQYNSRHMISNRTLKWLSRQYLHEFLRMMRGCWALQTWQTTYISQAIPGIVESSSNQHAYYIICIQGMGL